MTIARKTMLIIATVLVVGGAGLAAWAFGAAEFSFENLSTTARDWTQTTRALDPEADAPHTSIIVRDASEHVRFEPTSADAIEVTYWTSSDKSVNFTDKDGVLTIKGTAKPYRGVLLMADFQDRTTVVKVPRDWKGSITAETSSGNVYIADLEELEALSLVASSGDVSTLRAGARTVDLRTSSGSVAAVDVQAGTFAAVASSGSLALSDVDADAVKTDTSSGHQSLGDVSAAAVNARSSSGTIEVASMNAAAIELEASSGNVNALFVGTAGDYEIATSSTSGYVDAPSGTTGATKSILVRTKSGNITLMFAQGATPHQRSEDSASATPAPPAAPSAPTAPEAPESPEAPKLP